MNDKVELEARRSLKKNNIIIKLIHGIKLIIVFSNYYFFQLF